MHNNKIFFNILLLLLFSVKLIAQNQLSATVIDAETNKPIIGENVIIKELKKGKITDNNGYYNFSLPK